jgi:flagellar protein FliS
MGAYQNYLETTVATAEPLELTRLLYRGGIDSLRKAADAISAGDVAARNRQIVRGQQIIAELASSLDPEKSPELALRLAQVYEYVLFLMQKGNFEQTGRPLEEAIGLLETILSGWDTCEPPKASRQSAA